MDESTNIQENPSMIASNEDENLLLDMNDDEFLKYIAEPVENSSPTAESIKDIQNEAVEPEIEENDGNSETVGTYDPEVGLETKKEVSNVDINYEDEYNRAIQPIKAIGKTIDIDSIDELRQLASMGIDYTKKMQSIKPMRKMVDTLTSNNITENDINLLIEAKKGNKEAISQFAKNAKVDLLDLDITSNDEPYQPQNYIPSDSQVEMNEVIESIKQSPYYEQVTKVATQDWDEASRHEILTNPALLNGLFEEFQMNRFDRIQAQIDRMKVFGQTNGMTDLQLYKKIVNEEISNYNSQVEQQLQPQYYPQYQPQPQPVVSTVNRNSGKYKAMPVRGNSSNTQSSRRLDPSALLSMSDDEFEHLNLNKFI